MTYGVLVGRFGGLVREQHVTTPSAPEPAPFPDALQAEREVIAHHLIPLALMARADGEYAESERRVIVDHCLSLLERIGVKPSASDRATLENYVSGFRPSLVQLDPALKKLEHESAESLSALLTAAKKLMEADGKIDPAEAKLLDELRVQLAAH
jgi:tellurite resistance protein